MSKKIRYSLIFIGFLAFCTISPLLVIYVGGFSYDFKTGKFQKTGILAIKTDPSDSIVKINGKIALRGQGNIRFLKPKDYNISVEKDNYFSWEKRLQILPNQVTWANPTNNKIYLFLNNQKNKILETGVKNFYNNGSNFVLQKKDLITFLDSSKKSIELNNENQNITFLPETNGFALNSTSSPETIFIYDKNFSYINNFNFPKNYTDFQISKNNQIYFLTENKLFKNENNSTSSQEIINSVFSFSLSGDNIYFIQRNSENNFGVYVSDLLGKNINSLNAEIPNFKQAKILITFEKEVFLQLDDNLYSLENGGVKKIASNLTYLNLDKNNSTISFIHAGELSMYNPYNKNSLFVTRSSNNINQVETDLNTLYVFTSNQTQVTAYEMDTRDRQNVYTLYTGNNIKKFQLNENGKELLILDEDNLISIKIR